MDFRKKLIFIAVVVVTTVSISFARPKAPFKVLFDNDFTNTMNCKSPYNPNPSGPWTIDMLKGSVDETAGTGIEVHLLQPSTIHVPWWPSRVYPLEEHIAWWKEHYGVDPMKIKSNVVDVHQYILDGGDPVKVFVDACHKIGQKAFISFRMNDGHHLENAVKIGRASCRERV